MMEELNEYILFNFKLKLELEILSFSEDVYKFIINLVKLSTMYIA